MVRGDDSKATLHGVAPKRYAGAPSMTFQRPSPLRRRTQASSSNNGPNTGSTQEPFARRRDASNKTILEHYPESMKRPPQRPSIASCYGPPLTASSYNPLQHGKIRLLLLSPAKDHKTSIEGCLASFTLETPPSYIAISYAWGNRRRQKTMMLNGETIRITASVWHALTALRQEDKAVRIWVDALSINQDDADELSSQVRIMDSIYSKAETVAVCLGPPPFEDTSDLAFSWLREVSNTNVSHSVDWTMSEKQIAAVVQLFEMNYWKRLWVLQEVFHAKRVMVHCGSNSIPLDEILAACKIFRSIAHHIEASFPGGTVVITSENHYSHAQILTTQGPNALLEPSTNLSGSPLEILRICRSKLAARPQDKILGVFSLLPTDIRQTFQPNFHKTPQEIFTEIVKCICRISGRYDIICESIRYPYHQNSFGLPSWVPDWSHSPDTLSLAATHLSHRHPYVAYSMQLALSSNTPEFNADELRIPGIQIGTITARGMAVGTLGRLSNYLMAFLEWRHILLDDKHYDQGHTAAFCRTLCLGDVPDDVHSTLDRQYGFIESPEHSIEGDSSGTELPQVDQWQQVTFDVFAEYLGERLGRLPLDEELQSHQKKGRKLLRGRQFLQEYFGDRMMGRCFCLLESEEKRGYMGMGTGYMGVDDLVVIAYGCSTPIVIRPTNQEGKYEFIGDIYVDGFMDGDDANLDLLGTEMEFVLC